MNSFFQNMLGRHPRKHNFLPELLKRSRGGPFQPSVWIHRGNAIGDFNNGFAVAEILSPDNTRVIHHKFPFESGTEENTIFVNFVDEPKSQITYQTVHRDKFPDVLINSAGSSTHLYAKGLKIHKYFNNAPTLDTTFFVHITLPDCTIDNNNYHPETDMTVVFRHQIESPDQIEPNMFICDTVPSRINEQVLKAAKKEWKDELSVFEQSPPIYCVVLGERLDNNKELSLQDVKILADNVAAAIAKTGGSVVLTTSPRTLEDKALIAAFAERLNPQTPCYCYDYNANAQGNNPFHGLLAFADKIIYTDDSMSMASDCIATGKPVYVYHRMSADPDGPRDEKNRTGHAAYTQNLLEKNLVLPIAELGKRPKIAFHPVNSANDIADEIRRRLALERQRKGQSAGAVRY